MRFLFALTLACLVGCGGTSEAANTKFTEQGGVPVRSDIQWWQDVNDSAYTGSNGFVSALTCGVDPTGVVDSSAALNACLKANSRVFLPTGNYLFRFPINMTARRDATNSAQYQGRSLIGAGQFRTFINCYTGNFPCIDLTGSNENTLGGFQIRADNPAAFNLAPSTAASIGILLRRGTSASVNTSVSFNRFYDVEILMTSDMTRNASAGTVAVLNHGGEHLVFDRLALTANIPLVHENLLEFAIADSSTLPTIGVEYEIPNTGAAPSTTIIEHRSMALIAYDSFRVLRLNQVANISFDTLYCSTRKLVSNTPAYSESIRATTVANLRINDAYCEESGLFGATYRMDHRYMTIDGDNENYYIRVQRAALDMGFTLPGSPEVSIQFLNSAYLANFDINVNYLLNMYNLSGDNNGFAASPIGITGTPNGIKNGKFTLDHSGTHSASFSSSITQYFTDILSVNYFNGDTRRYDGTNTFTPVAIGLTTAGTGTYTFQFGTHERQNGWDCFSESIAWTAHTGTGGLAITGLPFTSDVNIEQTVSAKYDGLLVGAGKQLVATIPANSTRVILSQADPSGGALLGVQVDSVVPSLVISGCYKIID